MRFAMFRLHTPNLLRRTFLLEHKVHLWFAGMQQLWLVNFKTIFPQWPAVIRPSCCCVITFAVISIIHVIIIIIIIITIIILFAFIFDCRICLPFLSFRHANNQGQDRTIVPKNSFHGQNIFSFLLPPTPPPPQKKKQLNCIVKATNFCVIATRCFPPYASFLPHWLVIPLRTCGIMSGN